MELHDALMQVSEIRRQMARSETFRGYRSLPAALSSLIAISAAALQPTLVPAPRETPEQYLRLWILAASLSAGITALEMILRGLRTASALTMRQTLLAVEQFLPCTIVGGASTLILSHCGVEQMALLPGLWALFFSLGLFASSRILPRPLFAVGIFYLVCGLIGLGLGEAAFSPWMMGATFGGGQALAAGVLYITLERNHDSEA